MNNKQISEYMSKMSDDELKECEYEIVSWAETGVLSDDAKLRVLFNKVKEYNTPIFMIQTVVEHEIALRWTKGAK